MASMKRGAGGRRDAAWREIGRRAIIEFHRYGRAKYPKCSAMSKTTGERCRQLALENGKCHYHGGRTPKGDAWHKVQLPTKSGGSIEKLDAKMRDAARRERRRAARVARMSDEERARYEAWQRAHKPGSVSDRDAARRDREAARMFAETAARPPRPPTPEETAIASEIARLKARLAKIDALLGQSSNQAGGESARPQRKEN
jgi:hypothetical protein